VCEFLGGGGEGGRGRHKEAYLVGDRASGEEICGSDSEGSVAAAAGSRGGGTRRRHPLLLRRLRRRRGVAAAAAAAAAK